MKGFLSKNIRVLSISPSTRSVGFAVMEGDNALVAWGSKVARDGDKNTRCLEKIKELIAHYDPGVLVLEDASGEGSHRSRRIRGLSKRVIKVARSRKLRVATFSRTTMRQGFFKPAVREPKQALAEMLAERFPEELGAPVTGQPSAWESEDYHMPTFDAVARAVHFLRSRK